LLCFSYLLLEHRTTFGQGRASGNLHLISTIDVAEIRAATQAAGVKLGTFLPHRSGAISEPQCPLSKRATDGPSLKVLEEQMP
jgi:hypothetical protein